MKDKLIQLTTYNQFGEFNFYAGREEIKVYLKEQIPDMSVKQFLKEYTLRDTRVLFDWMKENSKNRNSD